MLVDEVLKGIANDFVISGHLIGNSPLKELVNKHNKLADLNDSLPRLSERSTGSELKDALGRHDLDTLIELLADYNKAKKIAILKDDGETTYIDDRRMVEQIENNKERRITDKENIPNTSKILNTTISIFILLILVIVLILVLTSKSSGDSKSSFDTLDVLLEIVKVIFNN